MFFCTYVALVTAVPFGYTLLKSPVKSDAPVTVETLVCVNAVCIFYSQTVVTNQIYFGGTNDGGAKAPSMVRSTGAPNETVWGGCAFPNLRV